jgi:hypothetical protein
MAQVRLNTSSEEEGSSWDAIKFNDKLSNVSLEFDNDVRLEPITGRGMNI